MTELLLNPSTKKQLDSLLCHQPHAVIIGGAHGSGKKTTALHISAQILGVLDPNKHPYYLQILPDKASIGIDQVRQIKSFLGKKTTGSNAIRRIVLIADAHTMTTEAQNALLKELEEPPSDTMIVLTVSDMNALKATITSRAQAVTVLPISKATAVEKLNNQGYAEADITIAYHISGGQVGLLMALLDKKTDHPMADAVSLAKTILRMNAYERLMQVDGLSKQKEQLGLLIIGLQRVVVSGLQQAAAKNNKAQVTKFHKLSKHIDTAQHALAKNVNAKLILSNLFLQM